MLNLPGFDFQKSHALFNHSREQAEGMQKKNPDVYQGVMYSDAVSLRVDQEIGSVWEDITGVTKTFKVHKRGKALVILSVDWYGTDDDDDFAIFIKIKLDGVDVTKSIRSWRVSSYVDDPVSGNLNVLAKNSITGFDRLASTSIVTLEEGEHTIQAQGRREGDIITIENARLDILAWSAPEE